MDLKDIKDIIDLMKENGLAVFEMEKEGFKIKLEKEGNNAPAQPMMVAAPSVMPQAAPATAAAPAGAAPAAKDSSLKDIVSPMVGTFYRASSPDASAFVDVGKAVTEDTVVCIVEAMKVMNEIKAEISGTIAEVVAENGKPVQFGQVLFRVR